MAICVYTGTYVLQKLVSEMKLLSPMQGALHNSAVLSICYAACLFVRLSPLPLVSVSKGVRPERS